MCGIFGLVRNTSARNPDRASAAFVELGRLAIFRGRDAAGFALVPQGRAPLASTTAPTHTHLTSRDVTVDGIRIIKDVISFTDLWDDRTHSRALHEARITLGHTRWATQGARDAIANASPLIAGDLVGTHNGDIDVVSLPAALLPVAGTSAAVRHGSTDTEHLYQALHTGRRDRRKVVRALSDVAGRAALAWVDRGRPDRLYLARAALSPLSLAWDAERNLYWASNPPWFRDIDAAFGGALGFHDITMVREGTLLTVEIDGVEPLIADMRQFMPQCRASDARLGDVVVWRGFDPEDVKADKAQGHHRVAKARPKVARVPATSPHRGAQASVHGQPTLPDYRGTAAGALPVQRAGEPYAWESSAEGFGGYEGFEDAADDAADLIEEEAVTAALDWVYEGCSPRVVEAVTGPLTPSEEVLLAERYSLSGVAALRRFRREVLDWDTHQCSPRGLARHD